ncbi:MAG: hypothetical protein AAFV53_07180, partial [Myxococcota bacterium]
WQGERGTFGGWQMDNGGDLNGDGVEDLVATSLDKGGTIYIIWGHAGIRGGQLADADIKIRGNTSGRTLSYSLGIIGDINQDGADDMAVGEGTGPPTDIVLFYGPFDESGTFTDTEMADVRFNGGRSESNYTTIFGTPDISGDGFPDFVVGTYLSDEVIKDGGHVYIVEGQGW